MKIDDLTAAQLSLLRQLDEAPRGEWTRLSGRDVTIALNLSKHDLAQIGMRGNYKSGRQVRITKAGRSLLSASRSPTASRTGLVEALLEKMGGGLARNPRGVFIFDPDALDRLAQAESGGEGGVRGERWRAIAADPKNGYGFASKLAVWHQRAADPELAIMSMSDVLGIMDVPGTIYGAGGYTRYIVRDNGEIVLLGSSALPDQIARAESAGIRVVR